jgi:neutral ceramidase
VARAGSALADAVVETARRVELSDGLDVRASSVRYLIARRDFTPAELDWAEDVLAKTGGRVEAHPDGIGDDYKALLYSRLAARSEPMQVEQTCAAIGDTAYISFPGELFTEIGLKIKKRSPFARTYIIGLANGCIGYVPTREAISQGGYEVDTRRVADDAADLIIERSLELLRTARALSP